MSEKDTLHQEQADAAASFYQTASTEECAKNLNGKFFRYRLVLVAEAALILLLAANWILQWRWPIPAVVILAILAVLGVLFLHGCRLVLYQLPEGILYHDCDPVKYVTLLRMLCGRAKKRQKLMLEIQLCSALYAAGEFDEALETLERIEPAIRSGMATFVIDLHAKLDAEREDYSRFPEYIERLNKMYDQYKTNDQAVAQIIGTLNSVEFYRNLHEEKLDECRKTLEIWERVSTNEYQKVYTKYLLGQVLRTSDPKRARACFRYVAEHGNTMYQVQRAAQQLEEN